MIRHEPIVHMPGLSSSSSHPEKSDRETRSPTGYGTQEHGKPVKLSSASGCVCEGGRGEAAARVAAVKVDGQVEPRAQRPL